MATLISSPRIQLIDENGEPLVGAKLYTYQTGTTTPVATYTTSALNVAHANPIISDANGFFPAIYPDPDLGALKFRFFDVNDVNLGIDTDPAYAPEAALTQAEVGEALYPITDAEDAEDVTPADFSYPPGDPRRYGVVGDNFANDTTALNVWASIPGHKFGVGGLVCKVTGQINFLSNEDIDFRGMVIDGSTGSTFTNYAVCYEVGTLTGISGLSASPTAASRALAFDTAHTLSENDVGIIYNPTDSSLSAARTYYRAGEFFKVEEVGSSTAIKAWNGLYAGYTESAVTVYKLAANVVSWRNLTVKAPTTGLITPIKVSLATKVRLWNVYGYGGAYAGIALDRCYDVELDGSTDTNVQTVANTLGVSIGNCQDVRLRGQYQATRHAINVGGDDYPGAVPNRNIRIIGATLKSDSAFVSEQAADIHGNSQDIRYENCSIWGGAALGGRDVAYINCKFYEYGYTGGAMILAGSEWMGGRIEIRGCDLTASAAYSLGMIRVRHGTNTVADTHLIVSDCVVDTGATDTFVRGDVVDATQKLNVHINNITFRGSASLTQICRMVGTGSAGDADYIVVDKIINAPSGASLYTAVSSFGATANVRLMRQSGTVAVTPVSGAATADSALVTFRYTYGSKTPHITLSHDQALVNSKAIGSRVKSLLAASFVANIYTCDAANFGATTPVVNVTYHAST